MIKLFEILGVFAIGVFLFSCKGNYPDLPVVDKVDLKRYQGTWYEIARLPNSFERGLICVTANYTLNNDGTVQVINKGHKIEDITKVETAKGIAKVGSEGLSSKLRVSFFIPFYGDYWVLALDNEYSYALIGTPSREYLWILSRSPKMDELNINTLLTKAKSLGFDISKVEFVEQKCNK